MTRLGFGAASIGGLYHVVDHAVAMDTVAAALELGVGYMDVAPQYGLGMSERRLGEGLRGFARDRYVVSTKVGRLIRRRSEVPPGAHADAPPAQFPGVDPDLRTMWDMSRDGVRRSLDESRARLGLERIDIAYIHDPDDHMAMALDEAAPALVELRDQGALGAIGVGANTVEVLQRFVERADIDVILLANRYTLLDQSALAALLPACLERGVAVVIGGVMNSGLLADPRPGATFDYVAASPGPRGAGAAAGSRLRPARGPLKAAAVRFVLAHPAVVSVLAGVRHRAAAGGVRDAHGDPHPGGAVGRAARRGPAPRRGADTTRLT